MGQTNPAPQQRLVEYAVDRVLDETNTDTKILVLARQDGHPDSFPIWIGAAEGHAGRPCRADPSRLHVALR